MTVEGREINMEKPSIFIGSSVEGLAIARTLEEHLERDARIKLWTSDIFEPGGTTIESLISSFQVFLY